MLSMKSFQRSVHENYLKTFHEQEQNSIEFFATEHMLMQGYFWGLGAADILNITDSVGPPKKELVTWIIECYDKTTGGFGGNKNQDPCLLHTQHAVYVLSQLRQLSALTEDTDMLSKIVSYIASLQRQDGSFQNDEGGESDGRFSYCAMATLRLLFMYSSFSDKIESGAGSNNSHEAFRKWCSARGVSLSSAVKHIWCCQNFEGGFGGIPGAESHAAYTWVAVAGLKLGGALDQITAEQSKRLEKLSFWLSNRQCDSGGFNGRPEKQADVCYSWWVVASLDILGRTDWINRDKLTSFILHCQDPKGGIGDRPDNVGDVFHTFFGFAGLALMNRFEEVDITANEVDPAFALPKHILADLQ